MHIFQVGDKVKTVGQYSGLSSSPKEVTKVTHKGKRVFIGYIAFNWHPTIGKFFSDYSGYLYKCN